MIEDIHDAFELAHEEDLCFDDLDHKYKLNRRKDLNAFLILDKMFSATNESRWPDIIAAAEHDQIYLHVDMEILCERATQDDINALVACGVLFDGDNDGLMMFA